MLFAPILLTTVMKNWGLVKNLDILYWTSVWLGIEITAYFWGRDWKAKRRTLAETLYSFLLILNQVFHFWKYVVISVLSHASVPSHPVLANLDPRDSFSATTSKPESVASEKFHEKRNNEIFEIKNNKPKSQRFYTCNNLCSLIMIIIKTVTIFHEAQINFTLLAHHLRGHRHSQ